MAKKVLIVDDSQTLRESLKTDLESIGLKVHEAADGIEALEWADKQTDLNLIISDVNMPRMDGITLCTQLSQHPTLKSVPKLMITTEASPELKAQGKVAGVKAWILKPYNRDVLILAVKKLLQLES